METSALNTIETKITQIGGTTEEWNTVLSDIITLFGCTTGTLHNLSDDRHFLLLQAQQGIPEQLLPVVAKIPVGKGMAGIAAERKQPVQVCNLQTDDSGVAKPGAKETKMEGSLTVPLLYNGKLCGTLGIAKPITYEFTAEEIASLMRIGGAIADKFNG